uniref:DNA repair protein XRCC1 n=1 Tax=Cyprinus carpio TaxID=7962 RepID=A0A8C1TBS5_CYPCA
MPEIKLKHVVSCSSEDSTHKADNLLSSDTYRKWKAARPGEKQVSVILQLEKEDQIHSIDIGNEGSAFIEVLVGHSTSVKDQDFQVLLVTSSFMSPTESRNGTNTNRVRFFGPSQLLKATAQEKWDCVKIVCSQPYSKSLAYGVAFIKLHSPPDADDVPVSTPPKLTKLGQFRVKDESPSSGSNIQPGSLFFSRDSAAKASTGLKGDTSPSSSQQKTSDKRESPKSKPEPKPKPKPKSAEPVPFNRILEGVVFVLSGFQNPFRGELRDKALAMGARYRPDWTPDSTHLICAFANTPKYSQVKAAGGVIVRKEWVMDCHKTKQKISFKRYLMDGVESSSESEAEDDESEEETQKPVNALSVVDALGLSIKVFILYAKNDLKYLINKNALVRPLYTCLLNIFCQNIKYFMHYNQLLVKTFLCMNVEKFLVFQMRNVFIFDCFRVEMESRRKKAVKESASVQVKDEDPYGGSTDENTDAEEEEDKPIPELPDFLTGKRFYLYGKFPDNQKRQLQRYIIAFNGAVEDYMSEKVQFVVTSEGWDESFEEALMENGNLSFVKPTWIFAINDRQKLLPYQPYTVVP